MAEPVAPVRSRKKKPWWIKLLVLLVLTGGIGAMVWYNLKEEKAEETFATQPVKRGTVVDKLGETGTIELVRTDYDISRAQEKILRAGLPPFLAARLQSGH